MSKPPNTEDVRSETKPAPEIEPQGSIRDNSIDPNFPYKEPLRPEARSGVTPDNPGRLVGDDATAAFDNGPSHPTEHASSEALAAATRVERDSATADDSDMRALNTQDADPGLEQSGRRPDRG